MVNRKEGDGLSAYAPDFIYLGRSVETVHPAHEIEKASAFYAGHMPPNETRAWLDEVGAQCVWVGRQDEPNDCPENVCFDPKSLGLREVFRQGEYIIFEVNP